VSALQASTGIRIDTIELYQRNMIDECRRAYSTLVAALAADFSDQVVLEAARTAACMAGRPAASAEREGIGAVA
jgi:hypothetical protein